MVRITAESVPAQAFADIVNGFSLYDLWLRLAWHDIRQRFRRSLLGPIWLTVSMGIMIGALGLVFSTLFHQEISKTLPYIAVGIIFWGLLTSCINEGTTVFISAESFIRNVSIPVSTHFFRMMARNILIWCFNMTIYLFVIVFFGVNRDWHILLFIPGLTLFIFNVAWISLASGVLSTRYRDIPQVISNLIQVIFFVTPIFWSVETLPNRPAFIIFNPVYHAMEIVRAPLLGEAPPLLSWEVTVAIALIGIGVTAWLYRHAHARIAYWV